MIPYSNEYLLQYMATLDTANYNQGLKGMQNQTQTSVGAMNSYFDNLTKSITKGLKAKLSFAAVGLYVANKLRVTTKEVLNFQKQLGMVNTLLKVSRDELNKYGNEFERLSLKTGASKTEIADAAYQALSSGVGKGDLIGFLETASKTAIAGQATVEQSVGTITSIINAYKMEMSEAGKVADWLLTVQNEGVTTVRELGDQLGDVTSISAALGVSLNDVGGAIAQMTVNGNNTAKTITMLKSMLSELSKEGQMAADNFKKLSGQSFTEFIANGGTLQEAMIKMEEYAKKSNKSVVDLFSSVEAGSAALNLTGINAENFANKLNKVASSSGELETAYKTATTNIYYEWQKLTLAIDKQWNTLVETIINDDRMVNFIKRLRTSLDGENNNDDLEVYKNDLKEIEESLNKINTQKANLEYAKNSDPLGYMQNIAPLIESENQLKEEKRIIEEKIKAIEGEVKAREEAAKKVEETNQKIVDSENKNNTQLQDLRSQEEQRVSENKNNLLKNEFNYLIEKRNYIAEQKQLLEQGVIDRDTYNKNIAIKEEELYIQQQESNLKSLIQLQNYFKQIDDEVGENEIKKKVIQLEIEIQERQVNMGNAILDYNEDEFLAKQQDEMERYKQSIAANQMESLFSLENLFGNDEDLREERANKALEAQLQELEFERQLLDERLDFYNQDIMYAQQAADTKLKIKENELKQQQIMKALEEKNENDKLKIIRWSANTILSTYDLLAQGRIQSLEDFKKFAALELAELLASYGHKHAQMALSDGGMAIADFAKAATFAAGSQYEKAAKFTGSAKAHLASAAENAALAAAFGGAAAAINTNFSSDSSSGGGGDDEESSTQYDENINNVVESSKEDSEGTVYINVENSKLMKLFIKDIEKELNDGYNVTIIGKKK